MEKREQMIAALKKVMNSLAEVFMGFAHSVRVFSEQMEELLKLASDAVERYGASFFKNGA
ncbi:hypothetical protein [Enterococcus faecium]|uniref:hypothetical protein n=1 Tax=Enterococcus faecium TaxID=1352 RepID=UPI00046E3405|nr:hypothetical protein [Enterococcus faecium]EIB6813056.1 hypothetical protein [Enterococcus faecium]NTJ29282.1 hypothetical protein [Enterococcus faecium]TNW95351.1 hypothetical protein FIU56_05875 [Enterococcus faecium]